MGMGTLSKSNRKHRERRQARLASKRELPRIIAEQLEEEPQPVVIMNAIERQHRAGIIAGIDPLTDRQFKTSGEYTAAIVALMIQHPLNEDEDTQVSDIFFVIDAGVLLTREWSRDDTEFGPVDRGYYDSKGFLAYS